MLGMLIGGTLKTLSDFDYVFYFASLCIFVLVCIVIKYNAIPEYILQLLELVLGVICISVSLLYMKENF